MENSYIVFGFIMIVFLAMLTRGWEMRTKSKSNFSTIAIGFAVIGAIFILLYMSGYIPIAQ